MKSCPCGRTLDLVVTISAEASHTGRRRQAIKPIDFCLADLVKDLNQRGRTTTGSCCGHGKVGEILFESEPPMMIPAKREESC